MDTPLRMCCRIFECVVAYCSVVQCVAEFCRALQCVAVCCSSLGSLLIETTPYLPTLQTMAGYGWRPEVLKSL